MSQIYPRSHSHGLSRGEYPRRNYWVHLKIVKEAVRHARTRNIHTFIARKEKEGRTWENVCIRVWDSSLSTVINAIDAGRSNESCDMLSEHVGEKFIEWQTTKDSHCQTDSGIQVTTWNIIITWWIYESRIDLHIPRIFSHNPQYEQWKGSSFSSMLITK